MINTTNEIMFRLNNLNMEQRRISYQSSTGERLQNGSDDTKLFARAAYVDDKKQVFDSILMQMNKATAQNDVSDGNMKEIKNLLIKIKDEVQKGLTDTTDATAREAIATNIEGYKQNIFSLVNEELEGEYIFAGSNSNIKPFSMDANGKVTYHGDGHVRKTAVEENEYRDRGISGFDAIMYSSDKAFNGEKLKFSTDERILDQDGNEWRINVTNIPATGDGELIKYNAEGNATGDTKAFTQISPATSTLSAKFELTNPLSAQGETLESKHNIFDDLDKTINALRSLDSNGNSVSATAAKELLSEQYENMQSAFEGANLGHAKLGARNHIFGISSERVEAKVAQLKLLQIEINQIDFAEVAIEAKALELTFTSMYSTINKMNDLSLVNFIK